jgi:DNA polymerase
MIDEQQHARRAARQDLEAMRLFGVDFAPVRPADADAAATKTEVEPTVETTALVDDRAARAEALARLKEQHEKSCPHCTTATGHTQTVFGEGDPGAAIMFIGEAPGAEEDRTGRPFVGRAGQKLDEMIAAMGLKREDVYIANILKSRPPNNRTPLAQEVAGCAPFLAEQIRIIRPRVIIALGGPSAKFLLETDVGITRLRGQWSEYIDGDLRIDVMPTFHPAYLLRNYTRDTRQKVWSDLQAALARVAEGP